MPNITTSKYKNILTKSSNFIKKFLVGIATDNAKLPHPPYIKICLRKLRQIFIGKVTTQHFSRDDYHIKLL
jgi:hypothetical protein